MAVLSSVPWIPYEINRELPDLRDVQAAVALPCC